MTQSPSLPRRSVPILAAALLPLVLLVVSSGGGSGAAPAADDTRLIVLGFDGADGRTIEKLLAERPDDYPNFARLAESGTFARLGTVTPPESPVSWAALNTGRNPAKTGVPGFVKRKYVGKKPFPTIGFFDKETLPIEEFSHTPIPVWSPIATACAAGAIVLLFFLLVFGLLLRLRFWIAGLLALVLGGIGGWCGYTVRGLLPDSVPRIANPNKARNFWDHAADGGVESIVLDAAQAFDMVPPDGARVLAGFGLPDARGGLGDWCIYTTSETEYKEPPGGRGTNTAGTVFKVHEHDGVIHSKIYGPENFWALERVRDALDRIEEKLPSLDWSASLDLLDRQRELEDELRLLSEGVSIDFVIQREDDGARIRIGDEEQIVAVDEWSDYYHLTFEFNWLLKVHAVTRVKLVKLAPNEVEVFVNVLDIDPERPPFWQPVSQPFGFSRELAKESGTFETYGWSTATMPFKDEEVTPELMMEDVEFTMRWRRRLTFDALERDDWRLFMSVFSTTDRVQHMMYQYYDEEHPLYDEAAANHEFEFFGETIRRKDAIPAIYRQMDRIVGRVMDEFLGPNDTLIVCSDHGFQSFRRQVNVNNWLAEKGYLSISPKIPSQTTGLTFVDWKNTQAYSLGMGFIYLNLIGREPTGIVPPAEADELLARLRADLLAAEDEETGARFCNEVYLTKEIHEGPYLDLEADLIVGFAAGYRVSWAATGGGLHALKNDDGVRVPGPVCTDNTKNWSGGHVSVAMPEVAGAFFCNRSVTIPEGGLNLLHIAPTALAFFGLNVPTDMDLPPLEFEN
ncbi:MAG: alkaline phosphatase family protein [Planctomycetota bacterium]|nr:alkaline phosphatase family protein [Planctomycetota bacterium]